MKNSTPEKKSPKQETIHFIKVFARLYRGQKELAEQKNDEAALTMGLSTAIC